MSARKRRRAGPETAEAGGAPGVPAARAPTLGARPSTRAGAGASGELADAAAPAVHAVAPQLLRDRGGAGSARSTSPTAVGARRLRAGGGRGCARPRRAPRPAAGDLAQRPLPALGGRARASPAALAIGVAGIVTVSAWLAPLVLAGGAVPARLQPRAGRRALPQRHLVRDRMGRLPGLHRLLRQRSADRSGGAADRRGLPGDQPRPTPAERAGAGAAAAHRSGRRARASARDGTSEPLSLQILLDPLDGALMALSLAMPLIAAALLCARL